MNPNEQLFFLLAWLLAVVASGIAMARKRKVKEIREVLKSAMQGREDATRYALMNILGPGFAIGTQCVLLDYVEQVRPIPTPDDFKAWMEKILDDDALFDELGNEVQRMARLAVADGCEYKMSRHGLVTLVMDHTFGDTKGDLAEVRARFAKRAAAP